MQQCSLLEIGDHVDRVIGPTAAVLKVFSSVRLLEKSLFTDPSTDLCAYLSDTKRLEEALKFLADNCRLAIQWLEGIIEFLEVKANTNELYKLNVNKSLRILQQLQGMEEHARLDGGILSTAFEKLETEFRQLLTQNSVPLPMASLASSLGQQACVAESPFPRPIIDKLQAIIERLNLNDRLENCKAIYVEVRCLNAERSLESVNLSYLEILATGFEDVLGIENSIDQWSRHLELVVKHLFEHEYRLCNNVYERLGSDVWTGCFAEIATEVGILSFLQFGRHVTESTNHPIKLLKLLDIFRVLNSLRFDFNRLFSGKACEEIRTMTRDLIKRVVNGAAQIFWELPAQVELERRSSPPLDGSIPRLVSFVTNYCNQLLGDSYMPYLTQVLEINLSWRQEPYQDDLVFSQVYHIVKEIALNLDAWSKAYEDISLSYLFMMNNHLHFYNLRGTVLGNMMGESWLKAHEQYKDYFAALYLRESWGKLMCLINQKGQLSSSNDGRVSNQVLVKKLQAFNVGFDERYKKQSNWVISDENLRKKVCKHLVEGVVPIYKTYMQNYCFSNQKDAGKYVKYTAESLENMLNSLFLPQLRKYGNIEKAQWIGKIKEVMSNQFRLALKAV
ncbi:Exocyst subunit Exo70 family protein [Quillaja saponaria]|uniref:Exocyst subunit Exo70 family protein n=1 Tax=Quillaja saponaria TaxID=32244 RepID=A0AAD7LQV7_QUISA|nr:Exocyst subunit Exo70 family protein [Quillaja saponaria]